MDPEEQKKEIQDAGLPGGLAPEQEPASQPSAGPASSESSSPMAQPSAEQQANPVLANVPPPDAGAAPSPAEMTPEQVQKQADKNLAMAELAQKIQVADPNADPSTRAPNQVSPEEFDRLAEQYAAIKRGDTDLQINTDGMKEKEAKVFKDGTMNDIGTLMQTESGREMLDQISNNENIATGEHHTTTISPVAPGQTIYQSSSGSPTANETNGIGEDATVKYAPGESAMIPGTPIGGEAPATKSDVVLMHELNHAYHETRGEVEDGKVGVDRTAPDPVKPEDKGVAAEEYQTVGLQGQGTVSNGVPMSENDYRAERRKLGEKVPERKTYNRTMDDYNAQP